MRRILLTLRSRGASKNPQCQAALQHWNGSVRTSLLKDMSLSDIEWDVWLCIRKLLNTREKWQILVVRRTNVSSLPEVHTRKSTTDFRNTSTDRKPKGKEYFPDFAEVLALVRNVNEKKKLHMSDQCPECWRCFDEDLIGHFIGLIKSRFHSERNFRIGCRKAQSASFARWWGLLQFVSSGGGTVSRPASGPCWK